MVIAWRQAKRDLTHGGPVALEMVFYVRSPRKDLTNLEKALEDALKFVAFGDDNRVYRKSCSKEPVAEVEAEGVRFRVLDYVGPVHKTHLSGWSVPVKVKRHGA